MFAEIAATTLIPGRVPLLRYFLTEAAERLQLLAKDKTDCFPMTSLSRPEKFFTPVCSLLLVYHTGVLLHFIFSPLIHNVSDVTCTGGKKVRKNNNEGKVKLIICTIVRILRWSVVTVVSVEVALMATVRR
ncbi:TPA: hypothetical protein RXU17_002958 [Escherichia coli]|nr:hypothetical protein [Escherichia coli]